ncbi:hypothetical protein C8Q76DRAFT_325976 [Earliella scabrosa]|nr:hypothetical protein C8Q76DRAFT_325976 [Earliella scabrosa]
MQARLRCSCCRDALKITSKGSRAWSGVGTVEGGGGVLWTPRRRLLGYLLATSAHLPSIEGGAWKTPTRIERRRRVYPRPVKHWCIWRMILRGDEAKTSGPLACEQSSLRGGPCAIAFDEPRSSTSYELLKGTAMNMTYEETATAILCPYSVQFCPTVHLTHNGGIITCRCTLGRHLATHVPTRSHGSSPNRLEMAPTATQEIHTRCSLSAKARAHLLLRTSRRSIPHVETRPGRPRMQALDTRMRSQQPQSVRYLLHRLSLSRRHRSRPPWMSGEGQKLPRSCIYSRANRLLLPRPTTSRSRSPLFPAFPSLFARESTQIHLCGSS